eukprot:COSAG05_NODE_12005_length_487_cov_0.845361_1_plen_103_part_00
MIDESESKPTVLEFWQIASRTPVSCVHELVGRLVLACFSLVGIFVGWVCAVFVYLIVLVVRGVYYLCDLFVEWAWAIHPVLGILAGALCIGAVGLLCMAAAD